jgi:antitoxin component of MazEF toxin-antitoxin module
MSKAIVGKCGRNLAIRFPRDIVKAAKLTEGARVEISKQGGDIVISPAIPEFALDELFSGKTAAQWRAEYARAFDWGPELGREVVDE